MCHSEYQEIGQVTLPPFSGIRVMMMPIVLRDPSSVPDIVAPWRDLIRRLCEYGDPGIGYLTIDEALVPAGRTHRRPGIHVDGVGPDGLPGAWGGGGGPWAANGMIVAASHVGARAWDQIVEGTPAANGDCAHLRQELFDECAQPLKANTAYWLWSDTIHEALPMPVETPRQFLRISMPSDAPWYEGYTPNPLGARPTGPIHPPRPAAFMRGE